jgi:hypothetical protein
MNLKQIKQILKRDELENLSVYDLYMLYQGYNKKPQKQLEKEKKDIDTVEYIKRVSRVTKIQKRAILELVKIKRKDNEKFADEIINSRIFKLACVLAEKQKKLKKIYINDNNWYYKGKLTDVFLCMQEISKEGMSGTIIKEDLRAYCEGQNVK